MKKAKIDNTPASRVSDKSPRGSISEKTPLVSMSKITTFPKPQFSAIEEELSHLPYKENEVQLLAKQIGIDFHTEKDKYLWFLIQVSNLDLPPGWMREEDPKGGVYYHNPNENITSTKHPMILKFRALFNEILENEIAGKSKLLALKEKVQKYENEKEGRSPKRNKDKEFKIDKAKKFKAAASVIALTVGLSNKVLREDSPQGKLARPEPPQSIIDSDKLQERFNQVKEILEKRRAAQEEQVNEIDNLFKTEDILNMCKQYYIEQYGSEHKNVPQIMSDIEGFDLVDPMDIIEAAKLFNVRSTQAFLFWTLRAYCGLPLPEYWNKSFDTNLHREIYYNSCYDVKISVRPCYFYVLELINYLKQEAITDKDSYLHFSNKITLSDKLGRKYDVDLASMIKDLTEKATNERKNYFTYHQKKETNKEEDKKVTKKRKKDDFNPNYSDAHFVEIATQLGVDLNTEIHLLMVIEDFVKSREPVERWFYRQAADGPSFWVNHEQQKAVNKYPYLKELKVVIDEVRKNAKGQIDDAKQHMKTEFNLIKMLFRKYPEEESRKMLSTEAKNYVEYYLKNKNDGSGSTTNLDSKGYNLTGLLRKIGAHLSKHDIMDLLFYCPFDFTQYLGEDFLKSSESYLLKKLRIKPHKNNTEQEGSGEEDMDGMHDGSFESQDSNDSAKKIRLKIEDSKKLLDLAANIKGLNLDPEKKREFMKLLIDFDQKYGDHDLVDALEQDVTENMKDEADIMKNLAATLKDKIGKDLEELDSPQNNKKPKKSGQDSTKNSTTTPANKGRTDNNSNNTSTSKEPKDKTKKGGDTPSNASKTKNTNNTKDGNVSITKKGGSSKVSKDGKGKGVEGEDSDEADSTEVNPNKPKGKHRRQAGEEQEANYNFIKSNKNKKEKSGANKGLQGLQEEDSEEEDSSNARESDDDDVDKSHIENNDNNNENKEASAKDPASPVKASSKFVLDETGKMIFTSKRTQELLEGLAEEERTSTKRKNQRGDTKGFSSGHSVEGEAEGRSSLGYLGQSQALDDHEIVYQEIINENGERILVPINVKSKTRGSVSPGRRSKSPENGEEGKLESQKMLHSSSSGKLIKGSSVKRLPGHGSRESLGGDLPAIVGSSFKPHGDNKKGINLGNADGTWDPSILVETLQKYGQDPFSEERKKEDLESALRFSNLVDEAKGGDRSATSRTQKSQASPKRKVKKARKPLYEAPPIPQQTYKSLEPGLQHLEMARTHSTNVEKQGKLGLWTHVELFEMEESSTSHSPDRSMMDNRSYHDILKSPGFAARLAEAYDRPKVSDRTFYTPFRVPNLGAKRFVDYLGHLNSLMFMKKLNELITNFLIKKFASMQLENLGVAFKSDDPTFRAIFQQRYRHLIKQLRDNLLKKKEFVSHIYTKVITNGENLKDVALPGLSPNSIPEPPKHRHTQSNREAMSAMIIGKSAELGKPNELVASPQKIEFNIQPNNKHISVIESKSQQNFRLPQLRSHKKTGDMSKFKSAYGGLGGIRSPSMATDESLFDDNKFRTTVGVKEETTYYSGTDMSRTKKPHFLPLTQKQNDAEKILKSLNEHDQDNYKHYWSQLGDPLKLNSFACFNRTDNSIGLQPYHVLLMANRLGLQVHNGEEPDLAWIAYLALTVKLPESKETNLLITSPKANNRYQKVCAMKYGEHPGDKFFKTLLIYHQMRRKILFEYMSLEDQIQYVKAQSWAKLKGENGGIYYYNFLTKQKASMLPVDHKETLSKATALAMKGEVKEKLKLSDQIVQENDHLLTLFKNKVPNKK